MKEIKTNYIDKKGEEYQISITSTDNNELNLDNNKTYKLQTPYNNKYKKKGIFTSEIGTKYTGFAPIFTLATIISLAAILVAFLLWRL